MSLNIRFLKIAGLLAAAALLAVACLQEGLWWFLPVIALLLLFAWIASRRTFTWLPSVLLVLYLSVAAGGVLLGFSPSLMIASVSAALVSWELSGQYNQRTIKALRPVEGSYDPVHLRLLFIAVGLGLLVATGSSFLKLPLPFAAMLLAGFLVLFSLYRFFRSVDEDRDA